MRGYDVILHQQAWGRLASTRGVTKQRLMRWLDMLRSKPFLIGDFQQRDSTGRSNQVVLSGAWLITFWSDHAAREIHVVSLERVED